MRADASSVVSFRALPLLLAAFFALTWSAHAPAAEFTLHQVADLAPGEEDSFPEMLTEFGGEVYFAATPGRDPYSRSLYRTDGQNVTKVSEISPAFRARSLKELNGWLYYANFGPAGDELFRTDGLNVQQVPDILPGPGGSSPNQFHNLRDQLIFTASGANGRTVYRTDGVSATEIADIHPGAEFTPIYDFTEFRGELYFAATGPNGHELYRTDGTSLHLVSDVINPGPADSVTVTPALVEFRGELYFVGDANHGAQLYKTDGQQVTELHIDSSEVGPSPSNWTVFKDQLYFSAAGPNGRELFKTDGTSVTEVADLQPGLAPSFPGSTGSGRELPFVEYQGELYFNAIGPQGSELHKTDGETIAVVADMNDDFHVGARASDLKVFRGALYFTANGASGVDVYKTDGMNVTALNVNPQGAAFDLGFSERAYFVEFAGHLLFQANGPSGPSLFATDGAMLFEVALPHRVEPQLAYTLELDGSLYFAAKGPDGTELYRLTASVPEPCSFMLLIVLGGGVRIFGHRVRKLAMPTRSDL